jgi:hypothetical protein
MQAYMHLSKECIGVKCDRALYLARNKDTDELFAERIHHDKAYCESLMERARQIITKPEPPDRIANREDFYQCKWCDARSVCWGDCIRALPVPKLSCRQCCHSTADTTEDVCGARWTCSRGRTLSPSDQDKACDGFLVLPGLIAFAEPETYMKEGEAEVVKFKQADGKEWKHSTDGRLGFTGKELLCLPQAEVTNEMLTAAKDTMGAVALGVVDPILQRYPEEDSEIIWKGPKRAIGCEELGAAFPHLEDYSVKTTYDCDEYEAVEYHGGVVIITWKATMAVRPLIGPLTEASGNIIEIRRSKQ